MRGRPSDLAIAAAVATMLVAGCAHHDVQTVASERPAVRATATANVARGAEVFRANCAVCHTAGGAAAGVGPSLERERTRKNGEQTIAWIEQPDPPMPKLYPSPLSEKDVEDVAAYVQSL
jgi:mono/diheme cytochrome c family protein